MSLRLDRRWTARLPFLSLFVLLALVGVSARPGAVTAASTGVYTNPLSITIPGDGLVESCADPALIRGQTPEDDDYWYMYCTTDPLNDQDKTGDNFNFHLIPMLRSSDLVNWTYVGDAFASRPGWVADDVGLWAPNIEYMNGQYYLYYTAPWTDLPGGGSALGVATSSSPLGPWTDSGAPVVEPHAPGCCPGDRRWVFDADVIQVKGTNYIYYGSYYGGISARELSPDGLRSDPTTQTQITIDNRYEGPNVIFRDGFYYLFVSATDCCRGPLTGYAVFVGRSENPLGPFVDREGVSLLAGRVGGTPVIYQDGDEWVGPGHNYVFQDLAGQWWTVYHAVNRFDPYFEGAPGFTKRPVLLDAIDWIDGWPTLNGGSGPSNTPQHAPAAQPGDKSNHRPKAAQRDTLGQRVASLSDEFNGNALSPQWSWVRPSSADAGLTGESFRFETQAADLHEGQNNASVLTEAAPNGNYVVETRVKLNLPAEGCCFNYVQAGLVIYGDDDNFIKLVHVSIWNTRQTEFAKEVFPVPDRYPRYGNTVVGPPDEWTYLRIVKRTQGGEEQYTPYTSRDGKTWVRGGTWTHKLGTNARIGLVSMGGSGFTANFDYVRVYRLNSGNTR